MTAVTTNEVLLYVPNLIGYSRVVCTAGSLSLMVAAREYWILAIILYLASFVGDLFGSYSRLNVTCLDVSFSQTLE